MIEGLLAWASAHDELLLWLGGLSLLVFVLSIPTLPFLAALIPEDYFVDPARHRTPLRRYHPAIYLSIRIVKNLFGWLLIISGIIMLVLPGQGLLTILMGLVLSDFPGKFTLERRLAGNAQVIHGINWLRKRAGRPPLKTPSLGEDRPE